MVVIDDQPEVSIDDPSFLFESNEGFQEVTSRRAQKSKQKAALEEALKKSQEQQAAQAKRLDKDAKVPRCIEVSDMTQFITSEGYILAGEVVKHKNHTVCYTFLFFYCMLEFSSTDDAVEENSSVFSEYTGCCQQGHVGS